MTEWLRFALAWPFALIAGCGALIAVIAGAAARRIRGGDRMDRFEAFGDLTLDFAANALRRGGAPVFLSDDAARLMAALMAAENHELSAETLWRKAWGRAQPFDGPWLDDVIQGANGEIAETDVEIVVKAFTVRLADVTPKPFLRRA